MSDGQRQDAILARSRSVLVPILMIFGILVSLGVIALVIALIVAARLIEVH